MKKLVFMVVACATMSLAVSFSSCGNGAATDSVADSTVDSTVVADSADSTVADSVDTTAVDTTAQA